MRRVHAISTIGAVLVYAVSAFALNVSIGGTVKRNANNALQGATATLIKAGFSGVSNAQGAFTVTGTIPDPTGARFTKNGQMINNFAKPNFNGSILSFSIPSARANVKIEVFDIKGARIATVLNQRVPQGAYRYAPLSAAGKLSTSMLYLVHVSIDGNRSTFIVPYVTSGARAGASGLARASEIGSLGKLPVAAAVDTLEVTMCGYVMKRTPIESYTQSGIAISMNDSSLTAAGQKTVDSLFDALTDMMKSLDSLDSTDQFKSKDFASIREGFNKILTTEDSYHMKATVGFMVSSLLSLNTSPAIWKLVDSLDSYFTQIDSESNSSGILKKTLAQDGVVGLGKSIAASSLQSLAKMASTPEFPRFITTSYIQSIAENEVLPILDNMVAACKRMESCGDRALEMVMEGDTFNFDKGEIYLLDAQLHLLRAGLAVFCLYDMNLYAQGTTDMRWIDTARTIESNSFTRFNIKSDTLIEVWVDGDIAGPTLGFNILKYNMERPGFLTLRKNFQARIKADLLAVPVAVKAGIAAVQTRSGDQSKHIIRLSDLNNAENDLFDIRGQMIDSGISQTLANKFQSPESVADFVTELLSGPYTLDETVDSQSIKITVNLTAWLDNPVNDLRTLLPKYKWLPENEWINWDTKERLDSYPLNKIYFNDFDEMLIDKTLIDSIVTDKKNPSMSVAYLTTPCHYTIKRDSSVNFLPITLLNDANEEIPIEEIDSLIDAKSFLPYFNDYTFGGLFPGMDRPKWLDLVYPK